MEIGIETTELKKFSGATLENMSEYKIKNDYTKYNITRCFFVSIVNKNEV